MMLQCAVVKKVKQFPGSSREYVGWFREVGRMEGVGGERRSQVCLGCMHSGSCSFKKV